MRQAIDIRSGAIRPIACFTEGWELIKSDYWLCLGIVFVGMLIGGAVPFGILLGPMWCGIEIYLFRRMQGRQATFNHLFEGFNFFAPSLAATLIVLLPTIALMLLIWVAYVVAMMLIAIPQAQAQQGGPPDASFLASFFGLMALYVAAVAIVSTVLTAPLIFAYALIVEHECSGFEAVMVSIRAIFKNLGGVLALLILNTLLQYAGLALVCVRAYLVLPITFAAYAVAYRQVFPRATADDEPEEPDLDEDEPRHSARAVPLAGPASTDIRTDLPRAQPPETGITPGTPSE